jgi:hypothetical protein
MWTAARVLDALGRGSDGTTDDDSPLATAVALLADAAPSTVVGREVARLRVVWLAALIVVVDARPAPRLCRALGMLSLRASEAGTAVLEMDLLCAVLARADALPADVAAPLEDAGARVPHVRLSLGGLT